MVHCLIVSTGFIDPQERVKTIVELTTKSTPGNNVNSTFIKLLGLPWSIDLGVSLFLDL